MSAPDLGDQILDPAVIERRRHFRRVVVGVMTGAVGLLVVAGVCRANRASQAEEDAARYNTAPSVAVEPARAEALASPAELQDTHGGGPPTSPNAARFHRPRSVVSPKSRNASVLPR